MEKRRQPNVFILADDIIVQLSVDSGVVPLLLQRHAVYLPRFHFTRDVVGVDL